MSNNEELVIDVQSLSFNFGGPPILKDVNLQVHKGTRCLLVGNICKENLFSNLLILIYFYILSFLIL